MNKLNVVGNAIKKINLAYLINELEKQQEIAYELEFVNEENMEEMKRRELVKESKESCARLLKEHLVGFLTNNPGAVYEDWIRHLHPDNADYDDGRIDHRFYVEDSDHRHMWNEKMMEQVDCVERIVDSRHILPAYNHHA
mmetsp:Transcript_3773/g.5779  ORF Transcript_3773/g.5779 Transcript_3773/m.5779 type:complete len:140 (+) Transcript_3773:70-489(+)